MNYKLAAIVVFSLLITMTGYSQGKPAYVLYSGQGKKISFQKMIKTLQSRDIVLFGESHNNPIAHWLQLETLKELKGKRTLMLGAEMFETDNQKPLNEYLNGTITQKGLDTLARLWPNYKTDYAPLVNLAKENKIPFIATNIPRKYASLVNKSGFEALESLPEKEKQWIAPLPVAYDPDLPGYKKMKDMIPGHSSENLPKAQAIKDATMAHSILKNFRDGDLFIHFNGSYHSDNYEGILWYLKKERSDLRYSTITTVSQADCSRLPDENKGKADFVICIDEDMTTTY